ncbi:hypothetical protein CH263_22480 [Rhodococcus sp. 06-1059B-a]|nr:mycofactocin-coupled SDR family oxidoreductase [Rhodococcus sp. 06-1059B-a]OZD59769.1 hypothetical protein CH263_22480 [Rhodococcus sp. 06-1059B-a]
MTISARRFEGKTVFITGAGRGMGREHAVSFASEGANVVAVDLCAQISSVAYPLATREDLAETESLVRAQGGDVMAAVADVRDEGQMRGAVESAIARFGSIDVVVANAGICPITGDQAQLLSAWHDAIDVMLTGSMVTLRVTVPHLLSNEGGGNAILIGSLASLRGVAYLPSMLSPGELGYNVAKHGVMSLMKNHAIALGASGIRVNAVLPGGVATPMVENEFFAKFAETVPDGWMAKVLGGGALIQPEDISGAVRWLASDEARFVTGHAIVVDGGAHLI